MTHDHYEMHHGKNLPPAAVLLPSTNLLKMGGQIRNKRARLEKALILAGCAFVCNGWLASSQTAQSMRYRKSTWSLRSEILDAEYERVDAQDDEKPPQSEGKQINSKIFQTGEKSLIDLALEEADIDWKETPIPFLYGDNYINTKLAFMAELDGVKYGVAVPLDHSVALTLELKDGSVEHLSPDVEGNEELMEIMATQVHEHLGEDLKLMKTPKILTISGPLEKYTDNWEDKILPDSVPIQDLLDQSDEDEESFRAFMRQELGDEEYERTLKESENTQISEELLELFEIPGLGSNALDADELMDFLVDPEDVVPNMEKELGEGLGHSGVALKLISYLMPGDKSYSLVKLTQPYILVGKYSSDGGEIRFEMLPPEEERTLIPRLEQTCREQFEKAGLPTQSKSSPYNP